MFTHIAYNPEILSGKPHIVGTRLSIEFILELVASGATKAEMLKAYPQLTAEAIEEALRYGEHFQKSVERRIV
jgi:uncharacterized protein (DUF433 family)